MSEEKKHRKKSEAFVSYVTEKLSWDKEFASRLRRADNFDMDMDVLNIIFPWCHSEDESDKVIFGLIGASMARSKTLSDGKMSLGAALGKIDKSSGKANCVRLKQLLDCGDVLEVCEKLKPIMKIVESNKIHLCYVRLLDQLLFFDRYPEAQKNRWSLDCFRTRMSA